MTDIQRVMMRAAAVETEPWACLRTMQKIDSTGLGDARLEEGDI